MHPQPFWRSICFAPGFVALILGVALLQPSLGFAQIFDMSMGSKDNDLSVQSSVSLGLSGWKVRNEVKLVDELGMAYDVASLLSEPEAYQLMNLDLEVAKKIRGQRLSFVDNAVAEEGEQFLNSGKEFKAKFFESEQAFREELGPDQVARLQQVRFQIAVDRYGLAQVLAANVFGEELSISPDELKRVEAKIEQANQDFAVRRKELLQEANRRLLEKLPVDAAQKIRERLSEAEFENVLAAPIFPADSRSQRKRLPQHIAILYLARRKPMQKELSLDAKQLRTIDSLYAKERAKADPELANTIDQQLGSKLAETLRTKVLVDQCQRFGTCNTWNYGLIAQGWGMNEGQQDQFHADAIAIDDQLKSEITSAKLASWSTAIQALGPDKQRTLQQMLGL